MDTSNHDPNTSNQSDPNFKDKFYNKFNIIQWNTNGYYNKLNEIKLLLEKFSPKVLCLQETHLSEKNVINLKNFSAFRKDFINLGRACGGVMILTHNDIHSEQINITSNLQVVESLSQALAYISITDLFLFTPVRNLPKSKHEELCGLGRTYFVYLFLYSGLEFTLTFLTHHKFHYTSMQQGWMFFGIGLTMALLQGSWVRRLPSHSMKKTALLGLLIIIPSFFCIGLANSMLLLYFGLFLFAISTSMAVPSTMTLVSQFGSDAQKGTVMGIFRSLGALARALGPVVASICYWSFGATVTYCLGGMCLLWPWYNLRKSTIK
ncbi:major facilitator superfamily domain-containing protein 10-like [Diaphorina citri]|uniref:Major facilitator superfamily domain-containing protein 10-like n=1 Tax=Diaphorina citri TaxID=121845 RepID=A0A3Q0IUL6_DIACI|nr:major facilitator superfamily domain-containing protein 10-like [Diaphorina citri]